MYPTLPYSRPGICVTQVVIVDGLRVDIRISALYPRRTYCVCCVNAQMACHRISASILTKLLACKDMRSVTNVMAQEVFDLLGKESSPFHPSRTPVHILVHIQRVFERGHSRPQPL